MLQAVGISQTDALLHFRLAPLNSRRDMGMLGVIHRAVLGEGPDHFRKHFQAKVSCTRPEGRESTRRHGKQLETFRKGNFLDLVKNSILGLVDIYNILPTFIVEATTVKVFQTRLQRLMMEMAGNSSPSWATLFSPRAPLYNNQLRELYKWKNERL